MTISDRLAAIADRAEKATEGPWETGHSRVNGDCVTSRDAESTPEAAAFTRLYCRASDAEFIASAREDVPVLVAALRAALYMHRPIEIAEVHVQRSHRICAGCGKWAPWPCLTVRAVTSALGTEADQ